MTGHYGIIKQVVYRASLFLKLRVQNLAPAFFRGERFRIRCESSLRSDFMLLITDPDSALPYLYLAIVNN